MIPPFFPVIVAFLSVSSGCRFLYTILLNVATTSRLRATRGLCPRELRLSFRDFYLFIPLCEVYYGCAVVFANAIGIHTFSLFFFSFFPRLFNL